jgi:hypothetical protein
MRFDVIERVVSNEVLLCCVLLSCYNNGVA